MKRNLVRVPPVLGLFILAVASVAHPSGRAPFGGASDIAFGQAPHDADSLTAAGWMGSACVGERIYYLADADRRNLLAGVRLVWPGLLYRFLDNRLYAVEAEFPPDQGAFARLRAHLTEQYGAPGLSGSWQAAPPDTYVYQHRLRTVGWSGPDEAWSIWLTGHDAGGSVVMIDTTVGDLDVQQLARHCAPARIDTPAVAADSRGPSAGQ